VAIVSGLFAALFLRLPRPGSVGMGVPRRFQAAGLSAAVIIFYAGMVGGEPYVVQAALQGYNLLRTDRNGWIELATDGEQLWVEVAQ